MGSTEGQKWVGLVVFLAMLGTGWQASAVEFEPFRNVEDVCPECEKPKSDSVTLSDGQKLRCNIVAANDDFLVVEKYGEVRGIPNSRVKSKSFADGAPPSNLRSQDQIVLKSGHVLTGSIVDESDKPGHFQMKSGVNDFSFVVFKSEIGALYRSGTKKTVELPKEGSSEDGS